MTSYKTAAEVPAFAGRIADSEEGAWRHVDGDHWLPEFAGEAMTLAEIIDQFGPVTMLDASEEA